MLRTDPTARQLAELEQLHRRLVTEGPEWNDRIEAVYLSANALATFRNATSPAARISPGEPFHAIEVDDRWLIDWYQLREVGVAAHGPPSAAIVPATGQDEFVEWVRRHVLDPAWVDALATQGDRTYAVLSMCRGLRTHRTGERVSKREAARWIADALPEHAALIRAAVARRQGASNGPPADDAELEATRRFVLAIQDLIRPTRGLRRSP